MYLDPAGMPVSLNLPAESVVTESDVPEMNIDAPSRYPPRMLATATPTRVAPFGGCACGALRLPAIAVDARAVAYKNLTSAQRSFHFVHITTALHGIPVNVNEKNSGGTNPVP